MSILKRKPSADSPMSSNIGVAYAVKKKAGKQMMAKGGSVGSDEVPRTETGHEKGIHKQAFYSDRGVSQTGDYHGDAEKQKSMHKQVLESMKSMPSPKLQGLAKGGDVKGVHKPTKWSTNGGRSEAGSLADQASNPAVKGHPVRNEMVDDAKREHHKVIEEMRSMPKPKLAKGGVVAQKSSKFAPVTGPFKVRDANMAREEEHLISDDEPEADAMAPKAELEPMSEGPSDEALKMKMMAKGGEIEQADAHSSDDIDHSEAALDHHASMVSAIMAKRKMMAEGGRVALDDEEQPESYTDDDEAASKENFDEGMHMDDQPAESSEEAPEHDEEDVDDKDTVSAIRRKMKAKSPITK